MAVQPPAWFDRSGCQPMVVRQRIEMRPDVMLGKPVNQGIRVTIDLVLRRLAEGITPDSLLDA